MAGRYQNEYANGVYFMFKSLFWKIDLTRSCKTFSRKLVKQFFRNYKGTMFITPLTISGQFLLHMRRNGHKTTSGVKFDSIFELYVPDFLYDEKF